MFENVLGQDAVGLIAADLRGGSLPPSILLHGPAASGKGTAALELARSLSCEKGAAAWDCPCAACALHRSLSHPDLLLLGPRDFAPELRASAAAFQREPVSAARTLFVRSCRKLLARFHPLLWEGDEAKLGKAAAIAAGLAEDLEEITQAGPDADEAKVRKSAEAALQSALKLEAEGLPDSTPIGQIRRASYWARLAPSGRRKAVVVENAERMQEGARNALLKILEEPPATCAIVLTTSRRGAMLPTVLSRLRSYPFAARSAAVERDVVRRVFRDAAAVSGPTEGAAAGSGLLASYLNSFLPVSPDDVDAAAAYFAASAAAAAVPAARRASGGEVPPSLVALGKAASDRARSAGFGGPRPSAREAAAAVLERTSKFDSRGLFPAFLDRLLFYATRPARDEASGPAAAELASRWASAARAAAEAVGVYNQVPALALEKLFADLAASAAGGRA